MELLYAEKPSDVWCYGLLDFKTFSAAFIFEDSYDWLRDHGSDSSTSQPEQPGELSQSWLEKQLLSVALENTEAVFSRPLQFVAGHCLSLPLRRS